MDYNEKKMMNDLLKNATTNEEKKDIIFEWTREKRKTETTKAMMQTLGVATTGTFIMLIMITFKELFRK